MELIAAGKGIIETEWIAISSNEGENGFENNFYGCSFEEYTSKILPKLLNDSKGINLPEGHVPQTTFFLWHKNIIIGLFKVRHYVNEKTRSNGAGHIGYMIFKKYRGQGYGSKGLNLAIKELIKMKDYEPKDGIIMGAHKDNIASLKVQETNGAKIIAETDQDYITLIDFQYFVNKIK